MLLQPLDLAEKTWECHISSGPLGSSGAIDRRRIQELLHPPAQSYCNDQQDRSRYMTETVLLFRAHHGIADGVSLMAALTDLVDEAEECHRRIDEVIGKRKHKMKHRSWFSSLLGWVRFGLGVVRSLMKHLVLVLTTPKIHPFVETCGYDSYPTGPKHKIGRTVSWVTNICMVEEAKVVARTLFPNEPITINDVFVSCISKAIGRLVAHHRSKRRDLHKHPTAEIEITEPCMSMNVTIPVHLGGGVLPNRTMGNLIGAVVSRVPCESESSQGQNITEQKQYQSPPSLRLRQVHESLKSTKLSALPYIAHVMAGLSSYLPQFITCALLRSFGANSTVLITNARGFDHKVHYHGHALESAVGFVPLVPGLPMGVMIGSYNGKMMLSLNAESWAVEDGDEFLGWVVEEYGELCKEAYAKRSERCFNGRQTVDECSRICCKQFSANQQCCISDHEHTCDQ